MTEITRDYRQVRVLPAVVDTRCTGPDEKDLEDAKSIDGWNIHLFDDAHAAGNR